MMKWLRLYRVSSPRMINSRRDKYDAKYTALMSQSDSWLRVMNEDDHEVIDLRAFILSPPCMSASNLMLTIVIPESR